MPASAQTQATAKGSTVHTTLDYLRTLESGQRYERILAGLDPVTRGALEAVARTTEFPYAHLLELWRAADRELAESIPDWIERSGCHAIESLGVQLYGGILRKRSPIEFLTQSISLFRLYYHPGDMLVAEQAPTRAVLRLDGFPSEDTLFCRRQTGGLRCAIEIAGGRRPRVRHVRCAHLGDAFCEWELTWEPAAP